MNNEKNKNTIFFIKPFEVLASYILFARTWNIIKDNYLNTDDVLFASLMKAPDDKAKFGYVSMSEWKSKEAFKKALLKNSIFKFHHSVNGQSNVSGMLNIYRKIAEENIIEVKRINKSSLMVFIEKNIKTQNKIIDAWELLVEMYNKQNILSGSSLYKSVYKKNKFNYVIALNFDTKYDKNKILNIVDNYFKISKLGFKYISSLYKIESFTNKKSINIK